MANEMSTAISSAFSTTRLTPYEEMLTKFFECPVCLTTMFPPIFRCSSGHSICKDCHQRVSSCPRCRLPKINRRAPTPLENISMLLRFPCKFELDGCTFIGQAAALETHYTTCEYRPVKCPLYAPGRPCNWNDQERLMLLHLLQTHSDVVRRGDVHAFSTTLKRRHLPFHPIFVVVFDLIFNIHWELDRFKNLYRLNVSITNEVETSDKFIFKLVLVSCYDYIPTCTFTAYCDENKTLGSAGTQQGIFVHHDVLRGYTDEERNLDYAVIIAKDEGEVRGFTRHELALLHVLGRDGF